MIATMGSWTARLLVVDDDEMVSQLCQTVAESLCEVRVVHTPAEALRMQRAWRPDAVLLDKNLPQMNGLELLRRLRRLQPDLEAILMTAYPSQETAVEALQLRVRRYLSKPFDISTLEAAIVELRELCGLRRELDEAQRLRLQAERLTTLGQVAASVVHEISNPLVFVKANAAAAVEDLDAADLALRRCLEALARGEVEEAASGLQMLRQELAEMRSGWRDVLEGACRIQALVQDLRQFGRRDEPDEEIDLNGAVEAALRIAGPQTPAGTQVIRRLNDLPPVHGSANRMSQVFLNLVMNAFHALGDEGAAHREGVVVVSSAFLDGEVRVSVSDNGVGMTPEVKERIFDPFFTTKPRDVGTGLGLPICAEIVREAGGRIEVQTEPGKGTTFTVVLPPADTKAAETGRPKILVIDDEQGIRRVIRRLLGSQYDVLTADHGGTALELVRRHGPQNLDAVLCDLRMTPIDGIQTLNMLTDLDPTIRERFVFITGSPNREGEAQATGIPIIRKPFEASVLRDFVAGLSAARA
ncbi:MAG: response regulator [Deltaproteobacteria bacterium]|nr:MAG: response regulator [Deltaproteobacteria bacterium]